MHVYNSNGRDEVYASIVKMIGVVRGSRELESVSELLMGLLVLKYVTDDYLARCSEQDDAQLIRYLVPDEANFYRLRDLAREPGNAYRINDAIHKLQSIRENAPLGLMFQCVEFNSPRLGSEGVKNRLLGDLLNVVSGFDLRGGCSEWEGAYPAIVADAILRYMMEQSGKRGGEHFTPPGLSRLIASLMRPVNGEKVYDPFCGSGLMMAHCSEYARNGQIDGGCELFGQEVNGSISSLAQMSLFLRGESFRIAWGNTLERPETFGNGYSLPQFDIVVSHPPFMLKDWGGDDAQHDGYQRYWRGLPPRNSGDFACISHMVESVKPISGRMAVVVSQGVLFRGGAEGVIRESFIKENILDAVISLPVKMLSNTSIPIAILVFRKARADEDVLFIDASQSYRSEKATNVLCEEDLEKIESVYHRRLVCDGYSKLVNVTELAANDFNLSVARYVQSRHLEEHLDLPKIREERAALSAELYELEARLENLLKETGRY
jgi:type I restriction enzyme M protein